MTRGQHFTPPVAADLLVQLALEATDGPVRRILDPACGDGALLDACQRRLPGVDLVGYDIDPIAAERARERVPAATIHVADALAAVPAGAFDMVVMNPPYVGEKGNKPLFDAVRALGSPWTERCQARMDYLYFFVHLALDVLREGGGLAALTTAYWPAATSADVLRADLQARARVGTWIRFQGKGLFKTAPGQANLAVSATRGASDASWRWREARWEGAGLALGPLHTTPAPTSAEPWQPFVSAEDAQWLAQLDWTTRFADVATDRQGIVSGCDRLDDEPVFVLTAAEARQRDWVGAWFLEPLIRGSEVSGLASGSPPPGFPSRYLLYLDGAVEPPPEVLAHLEPARARLERRRETRLGVRPWWALHWPRDRALMRRPKLVTARRAPAPCFYLDPDGYAVSSDCTWIVADGVELAALRDALHTPEVARLLRLTGKWKGGLCEFYAEPLRRLRLPQVRR